MDALTLVGARATCIPRARLITTRGACARAFAAAWRGGGRRRVPALVYAGERLLLALYFGDNLRRDPAL